MRDYYYYYSLNPTKYRIITFIIRIIFNVVGIIYSCRNSGVLTFLLVVVSSTSAFLSGLRQASGEGCGIKSASFGMVVFLSLLALKRK
jgi:hypothetical protein